MGNYLESRWIFMQQLIFSTSLIVVALLLNAGLSFYKMWQNTSANAGALAGVVENGDPEAQPKHIGRTAAAILALGVLLLAKVLYNFYWFMIWDATGDGLGYLWLPVPILAVLFSTILLFIALPEKTKLGAFSYFLLIPALIAISAGAQRMDFHQLTEERAERVSQAIESYYAQKGHYPNHLRGLTPWYLLAIPGPVIIYGQEWCYDGGDDYYRLGYLDREHWSAPHLIGRIYQTKGEVPDLHGMCEREAIAFQKRYPDFPYEYWVESE